MNCMVTITLLASLLGSLAAPPRGAYFQAYRPPIEARTGDVATGTVVRQEPQTLVLNTNPCSGERDKQIVIFHAPFTSKNAEPASCPNGQSFSQITASQR